MVRFVLLLLAALTLVPAGAVAQVPPPWNNTLPTHIVLVGLNAASKPDSALGHFTVTIRDIAANPVPQAFVTVDFGLCNDLRVATDQHDPRLTVACAYPVVGAYTGANGVVAFTIVGTSWARAGNAGTQPARIFADGVLVGTVNAAAYDMTGANGVSLADLGYVFGDYFSGQHPGRSDYDGNGSLTLADIGLWWTAYFAHGSTTSAANVCP